MSHSVTYVLFTPETKMEEIEALLPLRLAPFDENMQVAPYETECWCIGRMARRDARLAADITVGTIDSLRASYHALPKDEQTQERWVAHIAIYNAAERAAFDAHPAKDMPMPDCETCKATGKHMTTYNPRSRWDWWVIGGRWDGNIQGEDRLAGKEWDAVYKDESQQLQNNVRQVTEDFLKAAHKNAALVPFAILTPEGEWREQGKMIWFGMVAHDTDKGEKSWHEEAVEILAGYRDHWMVAVDVHI